MDDDILDLPPEPSPYRDTCIEFLTRMLVEAEEGAMRSFAAVVECSDGTIQFIDSGYDSDVKLGGMLVFQAMRKMNFAQKETE